MIEFFVTPDLGAASKLQVVLGSAPEVVADDGGIKRALFRFPRTDDLLRVLSDLANGTLPEDTAAIARARGQLRTRAIFAVESARSRP